jgi:hypothetical protein
MSPKFLMFERVQNVAKKFQKMWKRKREINFFNHLVIQYCVCCKHFLTTLLARSSNDATTFSITTLSTKGLFVTLSINEIQHKRHLDTECLYAVFRNFLLVMLSVIMLSVIILSVVAPLKWSTFQGFDGKLFRLELKHLKHSSLSDVMQRFWSPKNVL